MVWKDSGYIRQGMLNIELPARGEKEKTTETSENVGLCIKMVPLLK